MPSSPRVARAVATAMLVAVAAALVATAEPGIYTVDENAYLATIAAVRSGGFGVPHTGELPPSRELLFFDPQRDKVAVERTPVVTRVPPFHALLAWPFSPFGWYGFVALEALAFVATIAIVFAHVRRVARARSSPYLAAAAVSVGSYAIEYAQGVWPQALSAMLVAAAFTLVARAWDDDATGRRALLVPATAGLLAGIATEVRYQNALVLVLLALVLAIFARAHRRKKLLLYAAGAVLPLVVASFINHARLGTWNPVTKGDRYITSIGGSKETLAPVTLARVFWGKVVDVTVHPPLSSSLESAHRYQHRDDVTGVVVMRGSLKKAWMQSCPWLGLAFCAMAAAWSRRVRFEEVVRRDLRAAGMVILPVLLLFAAAGPNRSEGFGSNQRYFFDLVPLAAIALALAWDALEPRPVTRTVLAVLLCGWLSAFATVRMIGDIPAETPWLYLRVPLVVAVLLVVTAAIRAWGSRGEATAPRSIVLLSSWALGLAIGWATGAHWTDDLATSHRVRHDNRLHLDEVRARLPATEPFMLVTRSRLNRESFGPLLLTHDAVVVDVSSDAAADAARLIDASLARGRRVFVLPNDLVEDDDALVLGGRRTRAEGPTGFRDKPLLVEVLQ